MFQVDVRFLQPARHVVELVGQRLDFVAGLDRDALAKVAGAEAGSAGAQGLDRHHHAAREKQAGGEGERQRAEEHQRGALDGGIERRVGLLDRRFHENVPAERRDRRRSGENLVAFDVDGFLHLLRRIAGGGGRALCTCASCDMSVLRSTRLMSGWAINRPAASTT